MTLEDVALAADTDTGNLSRIERGIQNYTDEGLRKIAKALRVPIQSLFDDTYPAELPSGYKLLNIDIEPRTMSLAPVVSWEQAANWGNIVDSFQPGDAQEWVPCPVAHGPRTFVLRVRGISMQNPSPGAKASFADGDLIYVDPDVIPENGKLVVARFDEAKEAVFRELVIEGDRPFLRAINPAWPDPIVALPADSAICGVVIGKWVGF